ncbi:nuclear transport factor 2 family protein [Flavobacterium sp. GT3R68]|uniref:nuclear transport factor 2 family protein n=1 Tax=Flavobacterium sp. GT3R68 TaxID=2594437 RepID=UPI000F88DB69|nr:nuclear transport factor 2 family protein [Flavobacterium sp. GT3R68]RTY91800.1 nuclear transport factor 2 family protein [Flavobacterium sp. GSN2]TRW90140.1 nuclear transport factor 2 family protein [Flavobacterium sp. GT3R68]
MSTNKETVEQYMQGFREGDHQKILSCLTDDVIWEMPGTYKHIGKEAFDGEIENDNFEGKPSIQVFRLVEENDVVIAEGAVQCQMKNGPMLNLVFCDVFLMKNGKIKQLTSYLMTL